VVAAGSAHRAVQVGLAHRHPVVTPREVTVTGAGSTFHRVAAAKALHRRWGKGVEQAHVVPLPMRWLSVTLQRSVG